MTSKIGSAITAKVVERMASPSGLNASLAALTADDPGATASIDPGQIRAQNVAAETADRSAPARFPTVNVYCAKITNDLKEKFRRFSGTVKTAIEVRHSQDRLEGLQDRLETFVDSVLVVLDSARGDWGDGVYYTGEYEVGFGPVKHGGKNFIQAATITLEIAVSKN